VKAANVPKSDEVIVLKIIIFIIYGVDADLDDFYPLPNVRLVVSPGPFKRVKAVNN
jgi:hypothetical protein